MLDILFLRLDDILKNFKHLFYVVILAGLGHVVSFVFYPVSSNYISAIELVKIAQFESSTIMLISILGFGVTMTATRDVALSNDYKMVISKVQSSRISFSLFLMFTAIIYGLIFGFSIATSVFILAPIFVLNYDFILYGLGKPLQASYASFLRYSFPMALCFSLMFFIQIDFVIFFSVSLLFYVLATFSVSYFSKAKLIYPINFSFFREYYLSIYAGLAGVIVAFYRFGYLTLLSEPITDEQMLSLAIFSKFCLFVVAGRRLVIQFFYSQIAENVSSYKLDKLLVILGFLILALSPFFEEICKYFHILENTDSDFFYLCGISAFAILLTGTSDAKLLLLNNDFHYFLFQFVPLIFSCVLIVFLGFNFFAIIIALVALELLTAIFYQFSLSYNLKSRLKV